MRVGILAPISHRFPPDGYGPWERVASDLAEGLVELGVDVTVFAADDAVTSAVLEPTVPTSLEDAPAADPRLWETYHIAVAFRRAVELGLDVVHSHLHVHALGYGPLLPMPLVTTLHGSAWNEAHHPFLSAYADFPFVSLSDAERRFLPGLNYVATVPNGIRLEQFPVGDGGERLVFVGRMAPEKAPDLAVEVARRSGFPLTLAGRIEEQYRDFFEAEVRGRLEGDIEYVGELSSADVAHLVGSSAALLMPLRWDEPFGLVVAESLAVGTPVIAWRRGAMPELIADGETGFLVDDVEGALDAVGRLGDIDRKRCRLEAEERLSHRVMAERYAAVYRRLTPSR
ncbi:MAG TPA: glycosyltransferase family 4 protein [Acidimicrobiia bacterium]|nr:glycosyltransferase family 4 protein [Acidimicrobiia bacterium]